MKPGHARIVAIVAAAADAVALAATAVVEAVVAAMAAVVAADGITLRAGKRLVNGEW